MPVVFYPPNMPLHEELIYHRQDMERIWASPLPFLPFIISATLVFLAGLWLVSQAEAKQLAFLASFTPTQARLIVSLVPPLVLIGMILLVPQLSSPALPYQMALMRDPLDKQLHWNLAVAATAHIYCGHIAQYEWLNLMTSLPVDDRMIALGYIKRVRSRLQQIPVLYAPEVIVAFLACVSIIVVSMGILHAPLFEAIFHSFALLIVVQIFMLYLFVQRWQHIRRLMELEEIFDELLPMQRSDAAPASEDDVTRWHRERDERWGTTPSRQTPPSMSDFPPAPWE